MFDFGKNKQGNVAIVFALSVMPLLATTGAAVDYSRASNAREFVRGIADRTGVSVAAADAADVPSATAAARRAIEKEFGDLVSGLHIDGRWLDDRHFAVSIEAYLATSLLSVVPGMPERLAIGTEVVARRIPPTYRTLPPRRMLLEPEASDYNRIYIYCFDHRRIHEADRGRSQLTPLADNGTPPTNFEATIPDWKLPTCAPGEVPSTMLRNVRGARSNKSAWDDPIREVYEYYADATFEPGTHNLVHTVRGFRVHNGTTRVPLDMTASPILETILCDDDAQCRQVSEGGIIPNRKTNRDPQTATGACRPGMLMYYGWEDRPPGFGWTDRDYDDIRLVMSCPEIVQETETQVAIVR